MPHPLDSISIASPCQVDWDRMHGNDQVRFCGECKLNVYNLSGMTRQEAETLVQTTEGRLCVRYFQRQDGTIITQDCPVGLQTLHRRKLNRMSKIAAVITVVTVVGSFCVSYADNNKKPPSNPTKQNQMLMGRPALPPKQDPAVMGEMVAPTQALQGNIATPPKATTTQTPPLKKPCKIKKKSNNTSKSKTLSPISPPITGIMVMPPTQAKPQKQ